MQGRDVARGLALFGIGLGILELAAPQRLVRLAGLDGRDRVLRLFGLREIASGLLILAAKDPERLLWVRVVGDALDSALLGSGMAPGQRRPHRAMLATLAVAPVVALDVLYWLNARRSHPALGAPVQALRRSSAA